MIRNLVFAIANIHVEKVPRILRARLAYFVSDGTKPKLLKLPCGVAPRSSVVENVLSLLQPESCEQFNPTIEIFFCFFETAGQHLRELIGGWTLRCQRTGVRVLIKIEMMFRRILGDSIAKTASIALHKRCEPSLPANHSVLIRSALRAQFPRGLKVTCDTADQVANLLGEH